MNIKDILSKMSLAEKIEICSGKDFWHTKEMKQYGIPEITMSDGPHGLRKQEDAADMLGINKAVPATSFPAAVSTGCSWDEELLAEIGKAIAKEAAANNVDIVLGPGANIKRNPLCGRNFEYYSEDPYLTGKLAASFIKGIESTGVGSSLKHFAFNNQEYKRFSSNSIMDEQTMREIYLTGFEIAVKEGKPSTVMSAYNKINGEHCSDSKMLLTDILRDEWGFDGMVLTDWGGMSNRIKSFKAGCDLCMPGGSAFMEKETLDAVRDGSLDENDIDKSAGRILKMIFSSQKKKTVSVDRKAHHELARIAAQESAVLMKNDDGLLPLAEAEEVAFIGYMAKEIRYQGAGSSRINPWRLTNVIECNPNIPFAAGCNVKGETSDSLINEAVSVARKAKIAVVFAGLTPSCESEGFDRDNMKMPEGHVRLIEAVADANANTVVVLMCGSVVELPWEGKVKSILYMGLPGQAGGEAIMNLLFGKSVPCGKLAESWPVKYEACVCSSYYAHGKKDAHYREGIYVGYRYYATSGVKTQYPFGHGLSYTSFAYTDLKVSENDVYFNVTNTGKYSAKEIAQLYIAPPKDALNRPSKELKAFGKAVLSPGETKTVHLTLTERSFALWKDGWIVPSGTYTIMIGSSSEEIHLTEKLEVSGTAINYLAACPEWYQKPENIPAHEVWEQMLGHKVVEQPFVKGTFTMDNTVMEMKDCSFIMKIMFKAVESVVAKGFNGKKDYTDPEFRMMINSAADASLSGMKVSGGMRNCVLEGLLEIANGHLLKGIGLLMKKY